MYDTISQTSSIYSQNFSCMFHCSVRVQKKKKKYSGVNGPTPGHVRFTDFWTHTLE